MRGTFLAVCWSVPMSAVAGRDGLQEYDRLISEGSFQVIQLRIADRCGGEMGRGSACDRCDSDFVDYVSGLGNSR